MLRKSSINRHRAGIWRRCRTLRSLRQIHAQLLLRGTFLCDRHHSLRELVFAAAVSVPSAFSYALQLFDRIPNPKEDPFILTTLIRAASHSPTPALSLSLYSHAERSGPRLNRHLAFPFLFRACSRLPPPSPAPQLHAQILKFGLDSDEFVLNALINFHAKRGELSAAESLFVGGVRRNIVARSSLIAGHAMRGDLSKARKLFDESEEKDLVSWNVMVTGYVNRGEMEKARELFDGMKEKDTVSWNAMIAGYVRKEEQDKAMEVFEEMRRAGECPDEVTMISLVSGCADSGNIDIGMRLHYSCFHEKRVLSVRLGNALIDMHAKCGSIERAMSVFREMRERDTSSWNSVIGGLALNGHGEESVCLFEEMRRAKVERPDEITFVNVLIACSHVGMVEQGRRYFGMMRDEYGIEPNVKHYGCIADMLGRAGLLEEAFKFVDGMKVEANPVIWRALLGACKVHGNVELGKRANKELLKMKSRDESGSGDYILLSNIYASMGEWEGVEKVRRLMDDSGVIKEAGSALIEATRCNRRKSSCDVGISFRIDMV